MLDAVLGKLARSPDPNLLVGFDHADDAGVYLIAPGLALVQTVDFFTPIVDDPYAFGQIAAANALSDIYAMGARPLTAMNIVGFPEAASPDLLEQMIQGGLSKLAEAGCTLLGGHSVRDEELKFGYAVTGTVRPEAVLTNAGARPGDALVLTKAIGTGVIATALKRGQARPEHVAAAVASMCTLNREAALSLAAFEPHGVTDITGFGLLGHAREVGIASGVALELAASQVPLLPGAREYAHDYRPQGLANNREFAGCDVAFAPELAEDLRALFFDPQTSGGLLVALPEAQAPELVARLRALGLPAATIGGARARAAGEPLLRVAP